MYVIILSLLMLCGFFFLEFKNWFVIVFRDYFNNSVSLSVKFAEEKSNWMVVFILL